MEVYMLGLFLVRLVTCHVASLEDAQNVGSQELQPRQASWTDLAWQTKCNNIDYVWEDCCTKKSGASWHSCNSVGWLTISGSGVLCYSLDEDHDCCDDSSVCDKGLGCCNGTCCQSDTSVTVCSSGCISREGRGCDSSGNCRHGVDKDAPTTTSGTGGTLNNDESDSNSATATTPPKGDNNHNECGTGANNQGSVQCIIGGKSSAPDLGLGLGLGLGVPTLAVAILALCA